MAEAKKNKRVVGGEELIEQIMGMIDDADDNALMAAYTAIVRHPVTMVGNDRFEIEL